MIFNFLKKNITVQGPVLNKGQVPLPTAGQAMMTATVLFLVVSLTIILGLAGPVLRQGRIVSDLFRSRESYFLAEAGMEDVVYRLKNKLPVSSSGQTLTIGGYTATTDTVNTSSGQVVTTTGNWNGHVRKVQTDLEVGIGVDFNYGIQVGNGGFVLGNNAGVNGNVYSNGDITGSPGAFITGSAYAANSIPLVTDQSNVVPSTPPTNLSFRNTSATQDVAQSFQVSTTSIINKAQFYIKKSGNPASATVKLVTDSSGLPSTNVISSGTLDSSLVTANYALVDVVFSSNPELNAGTNYWLVIDNSNNSSSNYYVIGGNDTYALGGAKIGQQGGVWSNTTPTPLDLYFNVFLGGVNATISDVTVGTGFTGDAWAHNVNDSTVRGNLYCQSGTGNNKSCDTSQSDPSPQPMPVSDGNIQDWKDQALSGQIFNGDMLLDATTTSLGPIKIVGNLNIQNNSVITLRGTVWVTGDIVISNNVQVNLASGYGSDSGVIVSDGKVYLASNAQFNGSGTAGSYVMLITTSDCPTSSSCAGAYAVDVNNNVGAVIINAQRGTVHFNNNSGAKEAVGHTIYIDNGVVITYESGLSNANFASGPTGGWDIQDWREVQ